VPAGTLDPLLAKMREIGAKYGKTPAQVPLIISKISSIPALAAFLYLKILLRMAQLYLEISQDTPAQVAINWFICRGGVPYLAS